MGNTISPAVAVNGPMRTTFVSKRLEAIRHTQNSIPNSMKGTDTFLSIFPVFYVVVLEYTATPQAAFPINGLQRYVFSLGWQADFAEKVGMF